jgi:hypothetical protein
MQNTAKTKQGTVLSGLKCAVLVFSHDYKKRIPNGACKCGLLSGKFKFPCQFLWHLLSLRQFKTYRSLLWIIKRIEDID